MSSSPAVPSETLSSGIAGLDEILGGGFPARRLVLVQGSPGSGKTTVGLQFLLEGVRRGESCLYVTLSETEEEIAAVAASHGWSLDGIRIFDLSIIESNLDSGAENSLFNPADVELEEATEPLLAQITALKPVRVVFDSLSEMRMLASHPLRYRRRILRLKQHLAKLGSTALFLDDRTSDPQGDLQLQSLAHGVVELDQRAPLYGPDRRQLRIVKMRGVGYLAGHHDVAILRGGAVVYPRLVSSPALEWSSERMSSGVDALDALMGGGPGRGTSTLIVGPAGVGKSMLASLYATAACARGERAALFSFEESLHQFMARSAGIGIDVATHLASGKLTFEHIDPASLSPSEFVFKVKQVVEGGAQLLGIDSLNGYLTAMSEERALALQLHELLTYLGAHGVATFLVVTQHGIVGQGMSAPIDVSYVADNVILMRYFESEGRVHKALSVVKNRAGDHEPTIRELMVRPGQVSIGPALAGFRGVLTGVPVFIGDDAGLLRA